MFFIPPIQPNHTVIRASASDTESEIEEDMQSQNMEEETQNDNSDSESQEDVHQTPRQLTIWERINTNENDEMEQDYPFTIPTYTFNTSRAEIRNKNIHTNLINFAYSQLKSKQCYRSITQGLSFLKPGTTFIGSQNQATKNNAFECLGGDKWEVKVVINSVDFQNSTIVGLMSIYKDDNRNCSIVTYWEGEIVDFVRFNLWTKKWRATRDVDIAHWKLFEAFKKLNNSEKPIDYTRVAKDMFEKYIFMRWKEKTFINNVYEVQEKLAISGFYYICIRRDNGHIEGFYYDPNTKPFQKLCLKPCFPGNGASFADYQFI